MPMKWAASLAPAPAEWKADYQFVLAIYQGAGPRRIHPFAIPMVICDSAAGAMAIDWNLRGPNFAPVSACAAAAEVLRSVGKAALYVSEDKVAMSVTGLPPLEDNSVYQCWWSDPQSGKMVSGGTFKVDENGDGYVLFFMPDSALSKTKVQPSLVSVRKVVQAV